jgi:hypothetical protein
MARAVRIIQVRIGIALERDEFMVTAFYGKNRKWI